MSSNGAYEFTGHAKSLVLKSPRTETKEDVVARRPPAIPAGQSEHRLIKRTPSREDASGRLSNIPIVDDKGREPTRSLYIAPLSSTTNGYTLNVAGGVYGVVESTYPARGTCVTNGYAFVNYRNIESAIKAFKGFKERNPFGGGGKLTVRFTDSSPLHARVKGLPSGEDEKAVRNPVSGSVLESTTPSTQSDKTTSEPTKSSSDWPNGRPPSGPRCKRAEISPPPIRRRDTSHSYRQSTDSYRPVYGEQEDSPHRMKASRTARSVSIQSEDTRHESVVLPSPRRGLTKSDHVEAAGAVAKPAESTSIFAGRASRSSSIIDVPESCSPVRSPCPKLDYFGASTSSLNALRTATERPIVAPRVATTSKVASKLRSPGDEDEDSYSPQDTIATPLAVDHTMNDVPQVAVGLPGSAHNIRSSPAVLNVPLLSLSRSVDLMSDKNPHISQSITSIARLKSMNDETSSLLSERTSSSRSSSKIRKCKECDAVGSELSPLFKCSMCRKRWHRVCANPRPSSGLDAKDYVCGGCFPRYRSHPLTPPPELESAVKPSDAAVIPLAVVHEAGERPLANPRAHPYTDSAGLVTPQIPAETNPASWPSLSQGNHPSLQSSLFGRSSRPNEAHVEMLRSVETLYSYKTHVECSHWSTNSCSRSDDLCLYAHARTDLLPPIISTKYNRKWTCFHWLMKGFCVAGERCSYAHNDTGFHLGPDGRCSMKHITCFYWKQGSCQKRDLDCVYAHRDSGLYAARPGSEAAQMGLNLATSTGETVGMLLRKLHGGYCGRNLSINNQQRSAKVDTSEGHAETIRYQPHTRYSDDQVQSNEIPVWTQTVRRPYRIHLTATVPHNAVERQSSAPSIVLNEQAPQLRISGIQTDMSAQSLFGTETATSPATTQGHNDGRGQTVPQLHPLTRRFSSDPRRRRETATGADGSIVVSPLVDGVSADHRPNANGVNTSVLETTTYEPSPLRSAILDSVNAKTFKQCEKCLKKILSNVAFCTRCIEEKAANASALTTPTNTDDRTAHFATALESAENEYSLLREFLSTGSKPTTTDTQPEMAGDNEPDDVTRPKVLKRKVDENRMFVPKKRLRFDLEGTAPWSSSKPFSAVPIPPTPSGETEEDQGNATDQPELAVMDTGEDGDTDQPPSADMPTVNVRPLIHTKFRRGRADRLVPTSGEDDANVAIIEENVPKQNGLAEVVTDGRANSPTYEVREDEARPTSSDDDDLGSPPSHAAQFTCQRCRQHHKKCCHDVVGGLDPRKCRRYILYRNFKQDSGRSGKEWLEILISGFSHHGWRSHIEKPKAVRLAVDGILGVKWKAAAESALSDHASLSIIPVVRNEGHTLSNNPNGQTPGIPSHIQLTSVSDGDSSSDDQPLARRWVSHKRKASELLGSSTEVSAPNNSFQNPPKNHITRHATHDLSFRRQALGLAHVTYSVDQPLDHAADWYTPIAPASFAHFSPTSRTREDDDKAIAKLRKRGVVFESASESDSYDSEDEPATPMAAVLRKDKCLDLFEICPQLKVDYFPRKGPRAMKRIPGVPSLLAQQCQERRAIHGNPHHELERHIADRMVEVTEEVELARDYRQETPGLFHVPIMEKRKVKKSFRSWIGVPEKPIVCKYNGGLAFRDGSKDKDRPGSSRARIPDEEKFPFTTK